MLLQVHDELLLEGPEDELRRIAPELSDIMVGAYDLKARLHVDLKMGPNWEDMKPVFSGQMSVVGAGSASTDH
jgi:DNA polymerase-1